MRLSTTLMYYPDSIHEIEEPVFAKIAGCKKLVIIENKSSASTDEFQTESQETVKDKEIKLVPLNHKNALVLRNSCPLLPVALAKKE